jgi:hypothetical protein
LISQITGSSDGNTENRNEENLSQIYVPPSMARIGDMTTAWVIDTVVVRVMIRFVNVILVHKMPYIHHPASRTSNNSVSR